MKLSKLHKQILEHFEKVQGNSSPGSAAFKGLEEDRNTKKVQASGKTAEACTSMKVYDL